MWRNYYDIVGFHRDFRSKELWIKPIIPKTMNHEMKMQCSFLRKVTVI